MFSLAGMHPRLICDGFEIAKKATLKFLETFKTPVIGGEDAVDKEMLKLVARTALRTKVRAQSLIHTVLWQSHTYRIVRVSHTQCVIASHMKCGDHGTKATVSL